MLKIRAVLADSSERRDSIMNALLEIVTDRGFHDAPMSLVAKRAKASPGVIYHHFASKLDIVQALWVRISFNKRVSILNGYNGDDDVATLAVNMLVNAYYFFRKHSREMRFLGQYESAGFTPPDGLDWPMEIEQNDFNRRFLASGILVDLPASVLLEMTFGLCERLARDPAELAPEVVRRIATAAWSSIQKP